MSIVSVKDLNLLIGGAVARPGISPEFLARNGVREVEAWEAKELTGFAAAGLWIPYPGMNSTQLIVNGKPYGRVRVHRPIDAKYLQPARSGAQVYIPAGGPPFGPELTIVEGEFKALALCESSIRAIGIGGISSAMRNDRLIPDLKTLIDKYKPRTVYFLGDSDTAFNFWFAYEATKLAKALPEYCTLKLPRIPITHPKGIDDVKEYLGEIGEDFMDFWKEITQ
jgi:hypothetical protein